MAWKESGGGADDPCVNHEEGETLLEAEDRVEDVTDSGAHANPQYQPLEEQPLIAASETSMAASSSKPNKLSSVVKLSATPKLSRKECSSIAPIHSSTTVTSSSSPKTSSSTSRNSKVPIVINLDPSDRVSLNTGSTLSVRTSPTHGKDGSSSPLPIPLQRSAVINNSMLPRNSQASHRNNDNEACIQVANIESDPSSSPDKEYEICSSKNLCGPNPKKVTVIVALILSIWASFILGVNIHKKVVTMEDRLSSMTQKMLELQIKYLDLQKKSSDEIISLHDKLHQVLQINNSERSQKESVSNIVPPSKEIAVDKRFQTTTKRPTPTTTLAAQTECLTKNGQKCILPFTFEGEAQEGCVHRWKDTAAWCAFKVDESGSFIDDKSSWDYCDESCPLAPQQKDDEFWNF
eukprot:04579.XXX_136175_133072_1 [CDS] Oithona nana genome sequencing.